MSVRLADNLSFFALRILVLVAPAFFVAYQGSDQRKSDQSAKALFFYEVTAQNGRQSHILGTVHAGVSVEELGPSVIATFDRAKTVIVENKFTENLMEAIASIS